MTPKVAAKRNASKSEGAYLPAIQRDDGLAGDADAIREFLLRYLTMIEAQFADTVLELRGLRGNVNYELTSV